MREKYWISSGTMMEWEMAGISREDSVNNLIVPSKWKERVRHGIKRKRESSDYGFTNPGKILCGKVCKICQTGKGSGITEIIHGVVRQGTETL